MERITRPLNIKGVGTSGENFTFEGHLAAFDNIDHDRDVIEKGAFIDWLNKSIEDKRDSIPVFWSHNSREPVGIFPISQMREDDKGLFVKGLLPRDDTFVTGRVIPQMKIGSVRKMSIGYAINDFEYKGDIRHLKSLNIWEGSLVALPSNDHAIITNFKSVTPFGNLPLADRQRPWDAEAAIGRVRQWAGVVGQGDLADPDVQKRYRQAFFWYDGRDADLLGSYKLPFADIVDGRLQAVPRGVFAAAGAMRGARGGVDITYEERPAVINNIEKYYEKMEMESPFKEAFRLDDIAVIDERNLEAILKTGARFSNKMAKAIISALKSSGLRDANEGRRDAVVIEAINDVLNLIKREANHVRPRDNCNQT